MQRGRRNLFIENPSTELVTSILFAINDAKTRIFVDFERKNR